MKQKVVGVLLLVLGVALICVSCVLLWTRWREDTQDEEVIRQAVREHTFVVSREELPPEQPSVETPEGDVISAVDGDQIVEEVVTYKNVLDIPKIECQAYIGSDTSAYSLSRGVGHHPETAAVGTIGNCVIAGHASRTHKCIFNRLEEMQLFDEFYAYDAKGVKHTYAIVKCMIVGPTQTYILDDIDNGHSTMTIYTCTEGGTLRFVIQGIEFGEGELVKFQEEYFSDSIAQLRRINEDFYYEDVTGLLALVDTKRVIGIEEPVVVRPWLSGESAVSDVGVVNFGLLGG